MTPEQTRNLEEQIAHLTRVTDDLSDLVREQGTEIARLRRQMALLFEREAEREAEGGGGIALGDQKPPHW